MSSPPPQKLSHSPEHQLPPIPEAVTAPGSPHDNTGATADNKPAPADPTAGSSKKNKVKIDKTRATHGEGSYTMVSPCVIKDGRKKHHAVKKPAH
ncbi:hypothetical protein PCANC_10104 [Puccinia coronata f. sp. avenae]|uniref:Uncharacterized protein n=1 Tax=Puccinia coronata f. sp. avenae TaxID=200324 RepID=A0A2N5SLT9_9BASI|nr:hypothetical protein PCANC_17850 [Puccinia coronata f. sp. avenae]PLW45859.1 hypothetical protein PCANC_10104 [Puccinia coronata f. sp. avenae]